MRRVFVDTGGWFAAFDRLDDHHPEVKAALKGFDGELVTSNYVFDETVTLSLAKRGHAVACQVGQALLDPREARIVLVTREDERAAWELFKDRPDKSYSFTDCTSFVLMRRLGIDTAVAVDGDFEREGFEQVPR